MVTRAAADDRAEELRQALDELPYRPAAPVRVVTTAELVEEARIGRRAGEMLPWSAGRAVGASEEAVHQRRRRGDLPPLNRGREQTARTSGTECPTEGGGNATSVLCSTATRAGLDMEDDGGCAYTRRRYRPGSRVAGGAE
jgi:hypothetical protein